MLSGIKDTFDKRHFNRLKRENKQMNSNTRIIKVNTKKLETIYDQKIKDLEELKKSVLQKAFNGEF